MTRKLAAALLLIAATNAICHAPCSGDSLRFNRDIRPILADNCFACHGMDQNARKGNLRLDDAASAIESGAIAPGKPEASELIVRILADDPNAVMPPPESKLTLTADQKRLLQQWIVEGAEYEPHWAFVAPETPVLPVPAEGSASTNPIDAFVRARLEQESLAPATEAPREALLRRLSLDLTGLPPSESELDAFLADTSPDAYARAVERLLQSPAYGERMALDWLDVARYADTYGYQADRESRMWPWRDWVIRAFNDNLAYDQFIAWQIAGDLLPNATQDQVLATGFNRLHRQTNEGGSILEEMRTEYVADRVSTFGTAFLGMTFDCARCHDHKFDPVSQREYYELFSFFNNIDESGMYSHFTDPTPSPGLILYDEMSREEHEALRQGVLQAEQQLAAVETGAAARFEAWLEGEGRTAMPLQPALHLPLDTIEGGMTPAAAGETGGALQMQPVRVESPRGGAIAFDGDNGIEVAGAGAYERTDTFSISLWISPAETYPRAVIAHHSKAREDAGSRGWTLAIEEGRIEVRLAHFWPGNAIARRCVEPVAPGEWTHLAVTYDGSSRAEGLQVFMNGAPAHSEILRDGLYRTIRYENGAPGGVALAARFRDSGFKAGVIDEFMLFDRVLTQVEMQALAQDRVVDLDALAADPTQLEALRAYFVLAVDGAAAEAREQLHVARERENDFVAGLREVMVMREMPQPRQAYILARGAYDAPTDPVSAEVPDAILPMDPSLPRNRLGLAQWLLDPRHPLTARVAVNRYWQHFFGRGLVETQEDFGTQGRPPTHPELLDFLARWFTDSSWNIKELHRLIVTSATYRQDSRPRPELTERDPYNLLLARGPRHRLSAEEIRDAALATSGLLTREIGGPSVKIYQPPGLWEDSASIGYVQDKGASLYRRSMYTMVKRTVPHPAMLAFDATSRETCIARRETTQTPLQALVLLNGPQFVEAARVLAAALVSEFPEVSLRVERIFRRLSGRTPDVVEREILLAAYAEQRAHFAANTERAAAYLAVGDSDAPDGDPAEIAATAAVIQAVMNFDEFQMKF